MRNKVIILSLSLVMVLCSSFSVFGATVVDMVMNEPSTSDTQGYLVITNSDKTARRVFYWSITPYKASDELNNVSIPSMSLVLNDDSVTFTALHTGSARVTLTRVGASADQVVCMSSQFTTSDSYTYTGMSGIKYYCYSGNVGVVDDNISSSSNYLTVNWGSSTDYQEEFDDVINELVTIDTRLHNISNYVNGLEGSVDATNVALRDVNSTLSDIKSYIDTVEAKLNTINGNIVDVEDELKTVNKYLQGVVDILAEIWELLINVDLNVSYIESDVNFIKNQLIDIIGMLGEESTSKLDDSDIDDLGSDEDDVLDDDTDLIDDLSLSFGNAFDVVWDLISQAWQSNPKVFTVVIMCLTIGVLKLILNR